MMEVVEKKPLPLHDVVEALKRAGEERELEYEQSLTLEYAQQMQGDVEKIKALEALGLDSAIAINLVDSGVMDEDGVRLVFAGFDQEVDDDTIARVLAVLKAQ
jgi:DNA-directed RNA polymerase subunit F